jgi:hypothetical protein
MSPDMAVGVQAGTCASKHANRLFLKCGRWPVPSL